MADIRGTEQLLRRHARALARRASIETGREIVRAANKDTGFMATTTVVEDPQSSGQNVTVDIVIQADYALYVIMGTRPHVIRPHGNFLVFEGSGGMVFARSVNHPGYRGNDFFFKPMAGRWHRNLVRATRTVTTS